MKLTGRYTKAGAELAARAQAQEQSLLITRAVAGSGQTGAEAAAMVTESQVLELHDKTWNGQMATVAAVLRAPEAEKTTHCGRWVCLPGWARGTKHCISCFAWTKA